MTRASPAPGPPLVIGYGNPLRADDGIGWEVARRLAEALPAGQATVIAVHQLTPELAEPIAGAGRAIFVDASARGAPGDIVVQAITLPAAAAVAFSHDTAPGTLLGLAEALYGAAPPAVLVSVAGADFGYGGELSEEVLAALPRVVDAIRALLDETAICLPDETAISLPDVTAVSRTGRRGRRTWRHAHA